MCQPIIMKLKINLYLETDLNCFQKQNNNIPAEEKVLSRQILSLTHRDHHSLSRCVGKSSCTLVFLLFMSGAPAHFNYP